MGKNLELKAADIRKYPFVVGTNQMIKAVKAGKAEMAFVAMDASDYMKNLAISACESAYVPCSFVPTMKELGNCCGIARGAVCAAIIKL